MADEKKFFPSIGFWKAKSGYGLTAKVNDKVLSELKNIQPGSRLYIKMLAPDERTSDNSPAARLVIFPPDDTRTVIVMPDATPETPTEETIPF